MYLPFYRISMTMDSIQLATILDLKHVTKFPIFAIVKLHRCLATQKG